MLQEIGVGGFVSWFSPLCLTSSPTLGFFFFFFSRGLLCTHSDWCCLLSILCFVGRRWKMSKQIVNRKHRLTKAHTHTHTTDSSLYFRAPLRKPCWWRFNCSSHTHTFKELDEMRAWDLFIAVFVSVCFVPAQNGVNGLLVKLQEIHHSWFPFEKTLLSKLK